MTQMLTGKVYVVTGGFGALGTALGNILAGHGAQVVLVDKEKAESKPRDSILAIGDVDLTGDAIASTFERVAQQLGGIDGLVNVAGGFRWETIENGSVETWHTLYSMNVCTALQASKAALPYLLARPGGRIVNVGAATAARGSRGMGAYAASKSGLARMTEAMADEFKDRGITVNAILPSMIDTSANRREMPDADFGRWVAPEALAQVVAFLLSDAAEAVNGALIPVTGRG